jgi:hypothetical protein
VLLLTSFAFSPVGATVGLAVRNVEVRPGRGRAQWCEPGTISASATPSAAASTISITTRRM